MHLLIILLDQLLGMLRSARKARQAEVVVPRQNEPGGSDPAASERLRCPGHGWMTVLPVWGRGPLWPPTGPPVHSGRRVHTSGDGSTMAAVPRDCRRTIPERHRLAVPAGSSSSAASLGLDQAQAAAWFERHVLLTR